MAYASQQDIVDRYGTAELALAADRDGDGVVDATAVSKALDQATDEINAYIGQRYDLPLANVPSVLVGLCCDIALYRLSATAGVLTDEKRKRYDDAVKLLVAISKRIASLGIDEPQETSVGQGVTLVSSGERQFSRRSQRGIR